VIKKLLKIILPIFILISAAATAWYLFTTKTQKPVAEITERIWQVETITAHAGDYSPSLLLYGKVESPELYNASAPAFGRVLNIAVKEGQRVKKGQLLAKMDEADFLPALKMAQAKIVSLDAQIKNEELKYRRDQKALRHQQELLLLGEQSLKRTQKVHKQKLASQSETDEAKKLVLQQQLTINTLKLTLEGYFSRLKTIQANREQAVAENDKVALALQRSSFYAPFDGVIANVNVAVGDQLASGKNLFSLYPNKNLEIRAKIPFQIKQQIEKELSQGSSLYAETFLLENNNAKQRFKLLRLSGQASASGIDAFFSVNGQSMHLQPGSFQQLRLFLPSSEPLYSAPYTALYGKDKLYKLIKDKNNISRMQSIKIKPMGEYSIADSNSSAQSADILLFSSDAIAEGEQIIITHLPNALNGLKVELFSKK